MNVQLFSTKIRRIHLIMITSPFLKLVNLMHTGIYPCIGVSVSVSKWFSCTNHCWSDQACCMCDIWKKWVVDITEWMKELTLKVSINKYNIRSNYTMFHSDIKEKTKFRCSLKRMPSEYDVYNVKYSVAIMSFNYPSVGEKNFTEIHSVSCAFENHLSKLRIKILGNTSTERAQNSSAIN